jgi:GR25 family glycosyltransferase involved in LPS biosynthesis
MSAKLNTIADITNIFYINLESRVDRRKSIETQLNNIGLTSFERFNAIKLMDGRAGCTMSHIKCLELAKERGYNHLLICEDDTFFLDPKLFKTQLTTFLNNGHTWDVVLFAGNNVPPYERIDETCIAVSHCQTTTCYLVNGHYFDTLLTNMKEGLNNLLKEPMNHLNYAIDRYWLKLQKKDNWLLITPLTVIQREDYSDIEKKITDYSKLMMDLDKTELLKLMEKNRMKILARPK